MKVVADAETQRILGAAILGTGGDEAIHGILDMMNADQPIAALRWAVPIHPTVSELIPTLLLGLEWSRRHEHDRQPRAHQMFPVLDAGADRDRAALRQRRRRDASRPASWSTTIGERGRAGVAGARRLDRRRPPRRP